MNLHDVFTSAASEASDRFDLWAKIVTDGSCRDCAEIGVYEGLFSEQLLRAAGDIKSYYMLDPWRHLDDWNKPLNQSDNRFEAVKQKALSRTEFASNRRVVLQGLTTEVDHQLPEGGLDYCYIDGDHTLRGITIDLNRAWSKMRKGGILAGDDFCRSIWQHGSRFEPTVIFPYAIYFAEAMEVPIYALPFNQFAIVADPSLGFAFHDLAGSYANTTLRSAMSRTQWINQRLLDNRAGRVARMVARSLSDSRVGVGPKRHSSRVGFWRGLSLPNLVAQWVSKFI